MSFTASIADLVEKDPRGLLSAHRSWQRVRLGDVASILNGFAFPSEGFDSKDGIPLIRIRDIRGTGTETCYVGPYENQYIVEPGNLLVGMDGDFNCASWAGPSGLLNQRVCKLTPDERFYNRRFLLYALPGYLSTINASTSSMTVKHLSSRTVSEIPLPLPPLKEQHRIVAKIEELFSGLDAGVAALERVKANLARYKASILKAAAEGRLTESWREENPDVEPASVLLERILVERRAGWEEHKSLKSYKPPAEPDPGSLPELPKGWSWTTLDAVAHIAGGVTKGQKRSADVSLRDVPYLRVANVQRGYLDLGEIKMIEATEDEVAALRLVPGDILFTEGGDRDKLGRGWVWNGEIEECIHQNHIFRARLVDRSVQPKFISYHGNSFGRIWFQRSGKQSVNLASINMTILKTFPVPLAPAAEQEVIVREVEAITSLIDATAAYAASQHTRSGLLRQSILGNAFEGKLVPQDPTDEPALVLLERIKAERLASAETKPVIKRGRKSKSPSSKGYTLIPLPLDISDQD